MILDILWSIERPHKRNPVVTVKEGVIYTWYGDKRTRFADKAQDIRAYLMDGKIIRAYTLRADYDPCGRTDYYVDEEWSVE